jgi:hypothetical protein
VAFPLFIELAAGRDALHPGPEAPLTSVSVRVQLYDLAIDDQAKQHAIRRQAGGVHFGAVHPRPVNAILPSDLVFTATLQGRPFLRGHPLGNWPLHCAIGVICPIEECEFLSFLILTAKVLGSQWAKVGERSVQARRARSCPLSPAAQRSEASNNKPKSR